MLIVCDRLLWMKKLIFFLCVMFGEFFNLKLVFKMFGNIYIGIFYGFYEGLNWFEV